MQTWVAIQTVTNEHGVESDVVGVFTDYGKAKTAHLEQREFLYRELGFQETDDTYTYFGETYTNVKQSDGYGFEIQIFNRYTDLTY